MMNAELSWRHAFITGCFAAVVVLSAGDMAASDMLKAQSNAETIHKINSGLKNDAFLNAAALGDADAVARLIGIGMPVDVRDRSGRTALLLATHGNHGEVARILIDAGADVNAKDMISDSPYLYAAAEGRLDILMMTLAHGADLASTNRYGGTGLIPACHHGHIDVVYALLKTKIDINHVNRLGWTALLEAVILGDGSPTYIEIVQALVDAGAKVSIADRDGIPALEHARRRGFREVVMLLERDKK